MTIESSQLPTSPVIFAGHTGAGKTTLMRRVEELTPEYRHSAARFTTREQRPGETTREGQFVSEDAFQKDLDEGAFIYDYQRYGNRYGFHRDTLAAELQNFNAMLVGGKEDTSQALMEGLDNEFNSYGVVHPVVLFISRRRDEIIAGIKKRAASDEEKKRRIEAIEKSYHETPMLLKGPNVRIIENNEDVDVAARLVMQVTNDIRQKALMDTLGTKATGRDWTSYMNYSKLCNQV